MIATPTLENLMEQSIFELLAIDGISDDKKAEMAESMRQTIELRVLERFNADLTPEEQGEFERLMNSEDNQGLDTFIASHQTQLQSIMAEEVTRYRLELVALLHAVTTKPQP